jgi:hypothetical protein
MAAQPTEEGSSVYKLEDAIYGATSGRMLNEKDHWIFKCEVLFNFLT